MLRYKDLKLISVFILFLCWFLPFFSTLPYLDGNIDFVQIHDFLQGGFAQYLNHWTSAHPPIKLILFFIFFKTFGERIEVYTFVSIAIGIIGIAGIYLLAKELFNKNVAFLAALFLSMQPLYISNTLFSQRDMICIPLLFFTLYFYLKEKYLYYAIIASLAVLTKETMLLLPFAVLFVEIVFNFLHSKKLIVSNYIFFLAPLGIYYAWTLFLGSLGKSSWNDWNFSETSDKGAVVTILYNLITFQFLNKYAFEQWKHLFILNFIWTSWVSIFFACIFFFKKIKLHIFSAIPQKTIAVILIFLLGYFFSVLTFQTYTIPRYILPIVGFLVLFTAVSAHALVIHSRRLGNVFVLLLLGIQVVSLFYSIDPVSKYIWGVTKIFDQTIYNLPATTDGNDGITYNGQFLIIAKERSDRISFGNKYNFIISNYCGWIFPDPNNDSKTMSILKITSKQSIIPCSANKTY